MRLSRPCAQNALGDNTPFGPGDCLLIEEIGSAAWRAEQIQLMEGVVPEPEAPPSSASLSMTQFRLISRPGWLPRAPSLKAEAAHP